MGNLYSLSLSLQKQTEFYLGKSVRVCLILNTPSIWKLSQIMKPSNSVGDVSAKSKSTHLSPSQQRTKRPLWHSACHLRMQFLCHCPHFTAQMIPRCFIHVTSAHHTWLQNLRKTKNTVKCDRHLWTSVYCVKMDEKGLLDLTLTYLETKAMREWYVSC